MNYMTSDLRLSDLTHQRKREAAVADVGAVLRAVAIAKGAGGVADAFESLRPESPLRGTLRARQSLATKAVVGLTDANGALLPQLMGRELVGLAEPYAIVARLGLTRVPFDTRVPIQEPDDFTSHWVDAAAPKPLSSSVFDYEILRRRKSATLIVFSDELLRATDGSVDTMLARRASIAVHAFTDRQFLDPNGPFSVTSGSPSTSLPSTGDPVDDLRALVGAYVANGGAMETLTLVMSSRNAIACRLTGHDSFRLLGRQGGEAAGLPCVASDSAGSIVAALDVNRILLADADDIGIDFARHAAVQMADDPGGEDSGATFTSLWQSNLVGLRIERFITWAARPGSVAFITDADYLSGSPAA